ncbi:UPF0481 protein At3g47200-like isoform X2 [Bidens hawaiensis]|uniref:UPF0481 protein At3g47200-like isoform X2 n=1 Tax=Bidens hawaiensis TaxID=980011 RepID=UPI004049759C
MPQNMNQNHAITIDQEEVKIMMTEIKRPPKLLNKLAGGSSCCIFRVPRSLVEIKKEAYEPQIVSIGPYHFGNKDLEMIQEHKGRFLDDMLTRTVDRQPTVLEKYKNLDGKHLLDIFRKSFINTKDKNSIYPEAVVGTNNLSYTVPRPATKLDVSGVKFKANNQADSFLDIEFHDGLLLIPQINMDDFYGSFFLNCVTFEQCYSDCSKHFTTYIVFMGCLLNTSSDVSLLSQNDIVVNYFGSDKDVAKFFKAVGKDIPFNIKNSYLKGVFRELDDYCRNGLLVRWAEFKHTYFGSPWVTVSAIAAFMLLSLAFVQTFYTVFPYYHSNGQK